MGRRPLLARSSISHISTRRRPFRARSLTIFRFFWLRFGPRRRFSRSRRDRAIGPARPDSGSADEKARCLRQYARGVACTALVVGAEGRDRGAHAASACVGDASLPRPLPRAEQLELRLPWESARRFHAHRLPNSDRLWPLSADACPMFANFGPPPTDSLPDDHMPGLLAWSTGARQRTVPVEPCRDREEQAAGGWERVDGAAVGWSGYIRGGI